MDSFVYVPGAKGGDFMVKIEADVVKGPTEKVFYGFSYEVIDSDSFSVFFINESGDYIQSTVDDHVLSRTSNWQSMPVMKTSRYNELTITRRGQHYWIFLNNTYLTDYEGSQQPYGGLALIVYVTDGPLSAKVIFDNYYHYAPHD